MRKATKGGRTPAHVGEAIGIAERLQSLISSGWGASALLLAACVYLFHELRKADRARFDDAQAGRKVLEEENKVLRQVAEVLAQVGSKVTPPKGP